MRKWIPAILICGALAGTPVIENVRAAQQQGTGAQRPGRNGQQQQPPFGGTNNPLQTLDSPMLDGGGDPNVTLQEHRRQLAMMSDRQRRIIDDTTRLLKLAGELKDDVDKTSKDTMSLDVIRKADEIEKLAHDVKQRMKG